jgi:hypothetical protein
VLSSQGHTVCRFAHVCFLSNTPALFHDSSSHHLAWECPDMLPAVFQDSPVVWGVEPEVHGPSLGNVVFRSRHPLPLFLVLLGGRRTFPGLPFRGWKTNASRCVPHLHFPPAALQLLVSFEPSWGSPPGWVASMCTPPPPSEDHEQPSEAQLPEMHLPVISLCLQASNHISSSIPTLTLAWPFLVEVFPLESWPPGVPA